MVVRRYGVTYVAALNKKRKSFSVNKYGEEGAKNLAEAAYERFKREKLELGKELAKEKIEKMNPVEAAIEEPVIVPEEQPQLPKFSYKHFFDKKKSYTVGIIGSTKSGKTTFISELYPIIKKQNDITIFISNSINSDIYDFVDKEYSMAAYSSDYIKTLFHIQKKTHNKLKIALFFDDIILSGNDQQIKKLFAMGRNFNISTFYSVQDFTYINRGSRNNFNYLFLLKNNAASKEIADMFLRGVVRPPKKITRVFDKLAYIRDFYLSHVEDHNILIVDYLNDNGLYKYKVAL